MLRNRFTRFSFLLLLSAVTTVAIAAPPPGKGGGKGGGGGDDGGGDPPPLVNYELKILDSLGSRTEFRDVNDNGEMVGRFSDSNGDLRAFYYSEATGMIDVNTLLPEDTPWTLRTANSINNHGNMVGTARQEGDTVSRAYRLTRNLDGTVTVDELGTLGPNDYAIPSGINDAGEVAGLYKENYGLADSQESIWYYTDETGISLVDLGDTSNVSYVVGITNLGEIIAKMNSEPYPVVRVVPGSPPQFVDVPIYTCYVNGFNDLGDFVGGADFYGKGKKIHRSAYVHDGIDFFEITKEGTPWANDINNNGDVVGTAGGVRGNDNYNQNWVYLQEFQTIVGLDDAVVGNQEDLDLWFSLLPSSTLIDDDGVIYGALEYLLDENGAAIFIPFTLTPQP